MEMEPRPWTNIPVSPQRMEYRVVAELRRQCLIAIGYCAKCRTNLYWRRKLPACDLQHGSKRRLHGACLRQWEYASLSLSSPITMSFYFRSDTVISGANQSFTLFGSSFAISTTSANDSWKITMDGGGINVFNGTSGVCWHPLRKSVQMWPMRR